MARSLVCALALSIATAATAEIVMMPDTDYTAEVGAVTVSVDVAANSTSISSPQTPSWTVPASPRVFGVSPNGDQFLSIHEGGHIEKVETFLFVATLYRRDGESFTFRHMGLSTFGLSQNLPRDDLGLRWLDDFETTQTGWILSLPNGKTATIPFN